MEVLNDVFEDLAGLCKALQRENLTPIDAFDLVHGKINKIRSQYLGETVFWSESVKHLLSLQTEEVDTSSVMRFLNLLCAHLDARFPENEIKEWTAFDLSALRDCDFNFGTEEVSLLCKKYSTFLKDTSLIIKQYNNFKFFVQGKIKSGSVSNFADMVVLAFRYEEYSDLAKLMDIGATFLASSAACERGFSLMNQIKSKQRSRLGEQHLDELMRIKTFLSTGGKVCLDTVYKHWSDIKSRREKKLVTRTDAI